MIRGGTSKDAHTKGKNDNRNVHMQYINYDQEDEMEIRGYRRSKLRTVATTAGYFLTFGILRLVFHWYPHWMLYSTHSECHLEDATEVLIVDNYQGKCKSYFVETVKLLSVLDARQEKTDDDGQQNEDANTADAAKEEDEEEQRRLTIYLEDGSRKDLVVLRAIWCKKLCYVWDPDKNKFAKLAGLDRGTKKSDFHAEFTGFTKREQRLREIVYGPNDINVPVQSVLTLLVLEALNPFYIFQVFSLIVWFSESYYWYTIAIVVMSVFGISTSIYQTRQNQTNLRKTVQSQDQISVIRGPDDVEDVPTTQLVPGDVILIPNNGCDMLCDAVLLNGNCVVNESMLTGESVPVTKTPIPKYDDAYNIKEDANHTLYCGTRIIQTKGHGSQPIRAVVIRTGYLTTKGELVRSILYPRPADFKFDQDSYKFIGILAFIALIGLIYTVTSKGMRGISAGDIMIKALDLITIVIPPALPAAMTVGKLYALNRLKKHKIFCMNSRVINVSGTINCVCFDKTGTLTEDGLDMWGVIPVENATIRPPVKDIGHLNINSSLLKGMATCHSLTNINRELSGDPLDVKMFESTGWVLEDEFLDAEDTAGKHKTPITALVKQNMKFLRRLSYQTSETTTAAPQLEIGIIHQFQFSSALQRMSVITKGLDSETVDVYCKGSPETIIAHSLAETVPSNVLDVLKQYTEQGYRVIAIGKKTLGDIRDVRVERITRDSAENGLEFAGLIVLENKLKPETPAVISTLKKAGSKIVMITGDNIETALSVAKECGIIGRDQEVINVNVAAPASSKEVKIVFKTSEHKKTEMKMAPLKDIENNVIDNNYTFAMTGSVWAAIRRNYPDILPKLVTRGSVFARMSSEQKLQLVQELQSLGYYVAMCGDGANDCGALKAAHVGVSLSEAESSVASPFTSADPNISCIPKIIGEGRAALITSFGVFKFMVAYSLTEFTSAIILYSIDSNLTSLEYLFIDLCLITNFAFFFGKTEAYDGPLVKTPPMTSLMNLTPIVSLTMQMFWFVLFQGIAYHIVRFFNWFVPFHYDPTVNSLSCYENYAVFTVSLFQYIAMIIVFSKGKPYRRPVYTNKLLMISISVMTLICMYITVYPAQWIVTALELKVPPGFEARILMLALASTNFVASYVTESFFVEYLLHKKIRRFFRKDNSKKEYVRIEQEMETNPGWLGEIEKDAPTGCTCAFTNEAFERKINSNGCIK